MTPNLSALEWRVQRRKCHPAAWCTHALVESEVTFFSHIFSHYLNIQKSSTTLWKRTSSPILRGTSPRRINQFSFCITFKSLSIASLASTEVSGTNCRPYLKITAMSFLGPSTKSIRKMQTRRLTVLLKFSNRPVLWNGTLFPSLTEWPLPLALPLSVFSLTFRLHLRPTLSRRHTFRLERMITST